jgi:cytochrome c-type biogenesis protein CcmH
MKKIWLIALLWQVLLMPLSQAQDIYPLANTSQQQQFQQVLRELRCLVCQNQDLVDSNAGLAKDLRAIVYRLVQEGQSSEGIRQFLTERYGEYILFKIHL